MYNTTEDWYDLWCRSASLLQHVRIVCHTDPVEPPEQFPVQSWQVRIRRGLSQAGLTSNKESATRGFLPDRQEGISQEARFQKKESLFI